jgi:hypothetical protein
MTAREFLPLFLVVWAVASVFVSALFYAAERAARRGRAARRERELVKEWREGWRNV